MSKNKKQLQLLRFKLIQVEKFCNESNPNYTRLLATKNAYIKTIKNMVSTVK